MATLNDNQLNAVSGGATYYRIAAGDYLGNIAQLFGTSAYAIQQLNPGVIKNIDVIRAGDVIRVR